MNLPHERAGDNFCEGEVWGLHSTKPSTVYVAGLVQCRLAYFLQIIFCSFLSVVGARRLPSQFLV